MKKEKQLILLCIFFLFAFTIGQIRFLDEFMPVGDEFEMHININNYDEDDKENVNLRALVVETGDLITVKSVDIDDKDSVGRFIFWDTEGYEPGEYTLKFYTYHEGDKKVAYRTVYIY